MTQSKTLKIIVFLLVLILLGVGIAIFLVRGGFERGISKDVTVTPLRAGQQPRNLPDDLPIPSGATLTKNFEARSVDGTIQGTIEYTTDKSRQLVVREFQRYFTKKGIISKQELIDGGRTYLTAHSENTIFSVDLLDTGSFTQVSITGINVASR